MNRRWILFAGAVALIAAACAGTAGSSDTTSTSADLAPSTSIGDDTTNTQDPTTNPPLEAAQGVLPDGPSALETMVADEFPEPLVPMGEIISGGPPPDGIPPIDEPVFLPVADNLDLLDPAEAVVTLDIDGDARAYPIRAMIWHEIVNDTVGGVPVSVTYCPLCNSAVTYRREIQGVETTFGTSGRLFASALVMYDRATESLWTHFDGRAVVGVLTGEQLESIASPLISWGDFRSAYPTGQVLDWNQTGFNRDYGRNPVHRIRQPGYRAIPVPRRSRRSRSGQATRRRHRARRRCGRILARRDPRRRSTGHEHDRRRDAARDLLGRRPGVGARQQCAGGRGRRRHRGRLHSGRSTAKP